VRYFVTAVLVLDFIVLLAKESKKYPVKLMLLIQLIWHAIYYIIHV